MEMGSPNGLMRQGWTRNTLKVGDDVTVEGARPRTARNVGNARVVVLDGDGQRLFAASSQTRRPVSSDETADSDSSTQSN